MTPVESYSHEDVKMITINDYFKKTRKALAACVVLWLFLPGIINWAISGFGELVSYVATYSLLLAYCLQTEVRAVANKRRPFVLFVIILPIAHFMTFLLVGGISNYILDLLWRFSQNNNVDLGNVDLGIFLFIYSALRLFFWVLIICISHKIFLSEIAVEPIAQKWIWITLGCSLMVMVFLYVGMMLLQPPFPLPGDFFSLLAWSTRSGPRWFLFRAFGRLADCVMLICFYCNVMAFRFAKKV